RPILLDQRPHEIVGRPQRIVARIEEAHLGTEQPCGPLRFGAPDLLDSFDGHRHILPRALALAALAVRETQDAHAAAARRIERDGAAGAPDEVGSMGAENEHSWIVRHGDNCMIRSVRTLLGDYPATHALRHGLVSSPIVSLAFADVAVPNKAFKRVVRDLEFDVAELALMTFLMARSREVPLRLLPVVVFSRNPLRYLVCDRERGRLAPKDLIGRRIGVRSYTTTTAVWTRALLADQFGVALDEAEWITLEE